ncbi:protein FAM181B [Neosynchiropus ocellatus]
MAVQAAIMNPQFMSFCFPAAVMELEGDKGLEGSLLGEADQDFRETTRDLLSFIDSASSNIKLALDKPVKSKRKVNHRKYLQKQIKRCSGIVAPSDAPVKRHGPPASQPSPAQAKAVLKRDGVQANLQTRSLAALFSPGNEVRGAKKPPLRHRNLPPSFFTEPARCSRVSSTSGMTLKDLERGNPETADFFELLGPDYSNMVAEHDLYQRVQADGAGLEHPSYDVSAGLLHSDPWTSCSGASRRLTEGLRCGPGPVFCPAEAGPGPGEDNPLCTLTFSNLFADCSAPPAPYDPSGGFGRSGYSSL